MNKNVHIINHKSGKILSKTLIVLAIIGLMFTIYIGTSIANRNKLQTVTELKSIHDILEKALNTSIEKYGQPNTWEVEDKISPKVSYLFYEKYLLPNLNILRNCKNSTESVCRFEFRQLNGNYRSLNPTWVRFYLKNGHLIAMQSSSNKKDKVIYFYVDINGKSRFNVLGRDIYMFEYWLKNSDNPDYEGKLLPYGHQYTRNEILGEENINSCNSYNTGNFCSALIERDNWQIRNGYPWAHARYVVQ